MRATSTTLRLGATAALLLGACLSLPRPEPVELYTIDPPFDGDPGSGSDSTSVPVPAPGPVLLVPAPRAGPGLEGPRIAYLLRPNQLQYFSKSQWVEPPARLLGPLVIRALERTGRFQAVTALAQGTSPALRLDVELARLQQEFTSRPSRVRCTLRLQLIDLVGHRVIGTREVEAVEPAPSEDAAGGIIAANAAVRRTLAEAAEWCGEVGDRWRAEPVTSSRR
jgi:cholesterol transport system auxiliary component